MRCYFTTNWYSFARSVLNRVTEFAPAPPAEPRAIVSSADFRGTSVRWSALGLIAPTLCLGRPLRSRCARLLGRLNFDTPALPQQKPTFATPPALRLLRRKLRIAHRVPGLKERKETSARAVRVKA